MNRKVLIVGGGFGGLEVARELGRKGLAVTVVDRRNHHLFQPLLYQVATAALSATDIAEPIRSILRPYSGVQVLLGEVVRIDTVARAVFLGDGSELLYDVLVLATGASHSYFGNSHWARFAPGLKTLSDARRIRSLVLTAFERAELCTDEAERRRLMTMAIVGGGPTGVELAGSLAELSRYTLARDFRRIRPQTTRIVLLEAGPRVLPAFSERASRFATDRLRRLGVEVLTRVAVTDVGPRELVLGERRMDVGVVLWAAGVAASPLAPSVGGEMDKAGRIIVDDTMAVRGLDGVFALGDISHFPGPAGQPLPGLAQVAKQQGRHLGRGLARLFLYGRPLEPFHYRPRGNTAIVGRNAAVFEQGRLKMTGRPAWLLWAIVHVYLLVGFQHRMLVSVQWLWRYVTYEVGARLIEDAKHRDKEGARS